MEETENVNWQISEVLSFSFGESAIRRCYVIIDVQHFHPDTVDKGKVSNVGFLGGLIKWASAVWDLTLLKIPMSLGCL